MTERPTTPQTRKAINPLLRWLWDLLSLYSTEEVKVSTTFHEQVQDVKDILLSDVSGMVNSLLDFGINAATVDYTIESNNDTLSSVVEKWFADINNSLLGRIPTGIKALSKEYYRERWKNSSLIVLRTLWEDVEIDGNKLSLPTKMWFVDGENIKIETNEDGLRVIGEEQYRLKLTEKKSKPIPASDDELIFVQKPFDSWSKLYPIPFLIQRGLWRNLKNYELINKKSEKIVGKALEYLMLLKKGSERLALEGKPEYTYNEKDLTDVKENLKGMIKRSKSEAGVPTYVTNFDTEIEHLIPEYNRILNDSLYANVQKRLLAGLGLVEIVDGVASTRREGVLNPRPFIREIETGINDFISLLEDVMKVIVARNKKLHPKFFADNTDIQLHYTPVKDFISDSIRDHLRSMYDRGVLSKETYGEIMGIDIDVEVKRRKQEKKEKLEDIMYPPVIQNQEQFPDNNTNLPIKTENQPEKKQGPESKNFKGTVLFGAICKKCNKEFDYQNTPEAHMGQTKCPSCGEMLTDEDIDFSRVYEEAPYKQTSDLPDSVKVLPSEAQSLWMRVFNQSYPKGEDYARKVAWYVVKKSFKKSGDKWIKKGNVDLDELEKIIISIIEKQNPEHSTVDVMKDLLDIELKQLQTKVARKILEEENEDI